MKVYAIGDLHLGFTSDKPMDVFGERWQGHVSRLKEANRSRSGYFVWGSFMGYAFRSS